MHEFGNEVTVIAGVNGLGKSTLLNLISRLLVGPRDPKKAHSFEPGVSSRELIRWRDQEYFAARVSDGAIDAKAEATFEFGEHKVFISRSLRNLTLLALTLDGDTLPLDEERYGEAAALLCGVGSRYDFEFLVRNLVFFLEKRVPLFWNDNGQFKVFRILFFESTVAENMGVLAAEMKTADSHFRNMRWSFNSREGAYTIAKVNSGQAAHDQAELAALEIAIKAAEEARNKAAEDLLMRINERRKAITTLEQKRIELEEVIRVLQSQRQQFFARSFPDMPKSAEYILGQLAAGGGCLVCGNRNAAAAARVRRLISENVCPICESAQEEQENVVNIGTVDAERIRVMESVELTLKSEVDKLAKGVQDKDVEISSILELSGQEGVRLLANMRSAETLRARLLNAPVQEDAVERELRKDRDELRILRDALIGKRQIYEGLLSQARDGCIRSRKQ